MRALKPYEQELVWNREVIDWKHKNDDITSEEYKKANLFYSICILLYNISVFDTAWLLGYLYVTGIEAIMSSRCVRNLDLIKSEFISARDNYSDIEDLYYKFKKKFLAYFFIVKYIFSQDIEQIDLQKYQEYYDLLVDCLIRSTREVIKIENEQRGITVYQLDKILAENLYSNMKEHGLIDDLTLDEIVKEIVNRKKKGEEE